MVISNPYVPTADIQTSTQMFRIIAVRFGWRARWVKNPPRSRLSDKSGSENEGINSGGVRHWPIELYPENLLRGRF